jgi:hypothetical protein
MYSTAFRAIQGQQFEMALMVQKTVYFFLLEVIALRLWAIGQEARERLQRSNLPSEERRRMKRSVYWARGFIGFLIIFTVLYALQRYERRFVAFHIYKDVLMGQDPSRNHPLHDSDTVHLSMPRADGMMVSREQGENVQAIVDYLQAHTSAEETFHTYPESGTLNYLADRPFAGRFPIANFSWFNETWHQEFMRDLNSSPPKYFVLQVRMPGHWNEVYLGKPGNRAKHHDLMNFVDRNYELEFQTPWYALYRKKSNVPS